MFTVITYDMCCVFDYIHSIWHICCSFFKAHFTYMKCGYTNYIWLHTLICHGCCYCKMIRYRGRPFPQWLGRGNSASWRNRGFRFLEWGLFHWTMCTRGSVHTYVCDRSWDIMETSFPTNIKNLTIPNQHGYVQHHPCQILSFVQVGHNNTI